MEYMKLVPCYAIKDKVTGEFKKQRDYQFSKCCTMTALYCSKKRAETEARTFKHSRNVEVVEMGIMERKDHDTK